MIIFQGVHGGQGKTGKLDGTLKCWVSTVDTLNALNVKIDKNGKTNLARKIKYQLRTTNAELIELGSRILGCHGGQGMR